MIKVRTFLLIALIVSPTFVFGEDVDISQLTQNISEATTIEDAGTRLQSAKDAVDASDKYKDVKIKQSAQTKIDNAIKAAKAGTSAEGTTPSMTSDSAKKIAEAQTAYNEAKANEQSLANRTLTALTTAATGIGGMELAQGLSEQKADKQAEADMAAYIATMRCTYADGKQVKAGPEEIELPGGNDQTLMNLRAEYFALAQDLKERKTALGMKPGIESEEILDKAATGLYDDESLGIDSGNYASLYRAQMLGSEADQAKLDDEKSASKKRVLGGAIAAGAGVALGVAGDSLINGKLGEAIKNKKNSTSKEYQYFVPPTDQTEAAEVCALEESNIDRIRDSGSHVRPKQCKDIYDKDCKGITVESTDGERSKCMDPDKKEIPFTTCKKCDSLRQQRDKCFEEAEAWCKKAGI